MKTCTNKNCSQTNPQPLTNFPKNKSKKDGVNSRCLFCDRVYKKEFYRNNPEKFIAANFRLRYKISIDDYNKLLKKQNNVCALCKETETLYDPKIKKQRALAVDHCHTTGKIRGLLCRNCNVGLGCFKDNVDLLDKAKEYLKENNE